MVQVVYFIVLPGVAFAAGAAVELLPLHHLVWGAALGFTRFATGILVGATVAQLLDQLCSGRVPGLSELWHKSGGLSAQATMATTVAAAVGLKPMQQSAAALLKSQTMVPEGLPLLLLLLCAFPGCAPQAPGCFPPGWASGMSLALLALMWTAGRQMVVDDLRVQARSDRDADGIDKDVSSHRRKWLKVSGNQDVLVSSDSTDSRSSDGSEDEDTGVVIEAVVTEVSLTSSRQPQPDSMRMVWASYDSADDTRDGDDGAWWRSLASQAAAFVAAHLPVVALCLGMASQLVAHSVPVTGLPWASGLPWDMTVVASGLEGVAHGVDIVAAGNACMQLSLDAIGVAIDVVGAIGVA
ncbi:hypothetical protein FOA52_004274 [Chlamydomonas sp. UWO 241]|nr:hypothetical protein FOA52_004274 [Chlamydomonas sp. UWO 241]